MKTRGRNPKKTAAAAALPAACAAWALLIAGVARAAEPAAPSAPLAITLGSGSSVWLEGTSTLHHFESTATKVTVAFQGAAAAPAPGTAAVFDAVEARRIANFDLDILVTGLKSGKAGLDKNLYAALKAKEYPSIHFTLEKYALQPQAARQGAYVLQTSGELSIAGRTLPIEMTPEALVEGSRLRVRGEKELKMTDFGIKPPTLMLGTLKVGDRVTIHYDLALEMNNGK